MTYEETKALLRERGQEQLLRFYPELDRAGKARLLNAVGKIDWSFEETLLHPEDLSGRGRDIRPIEGMSQEEIARRKAEFGRVGAEAIRQGKVAAVLLAGGQGTRLGADGPKGAYNIGLTRPLSIFE
ncbi:MAG TPA: UTP--glucose-1-phosphate uridylyltransferase, partial [Candidatus Scatosoma pullistercoris]|nr:UTP--glucose-1-phosphate uridylyltransferase [Candidatus Scatosoma pullistercoris]